MRLHSIRTYKDGFKDIPYCRVCGVEYPDGDCPGELVVDKKINEKELTDKKEDTK